MTKMIYVRIQPKQKGITRFFRCGIEFTQAWQKLTDLDAATVKRLEEEQMLEVSETRPDDLDDEAQAGDSALALIPITGADTGTPAGASSTEKPADPEAVQAAVMQAIAQLDKSDPALFTVSNKPKLEAIAAITGWPVTAVERDACLPAVAGSTEGA